MAQRISKGLLEELLLAGQAGVVVGAIGGLATGIVFLLKDYFNPIFKLVVTLLFVTYALGAFSEVAWYTWKKFQNEKAQS